MERPILSTPTERQRRARSMLAAIIVLMMVLLACAAPSSVPASKVYWQAATPLPPMGPDPSCVAAGEAPESCPLVEMPYDPIPTKYIAKHTFYKDQNVNVNGWVLKFKGPTDQYDKIASPFKFKDYTYIAAEFEVWNNHNAETTLTFPYAFFIRELTVNGKFKTGKYTADGLAADIIKQYAPSKTYLDDKGIITLPPYAHTTFIAPIRVPDGADLPRVYMLDADLMSDDSLDFIQFVDELPPNRCDVNNTPDCYYAETDPYHYFDFDLLDGETPGSGPPGGSTGGSGECPDCDADEWYSGPGSKVKPVKKMWITQHYGCTPYCNWVYIDVGSCTRKAPTCNSGPLPYDFHNGIDIGGGTGVALYAVEDSTVVFAGWDSSGYGNLTILRGEKACFYYAHQSKMNVSQGAKVKAGYKIGEMGSTGNSSGPHLHFEMRKRSGGGCASWGLNNFLDPEKYLGLRP